MNPLLLDDFSMIFESLLFGFASLHQSFDNTNRLIDLQSIKLCFIRLLLYYI